MLVSHCQITVTLAVYNYQSTHTSHVTRHTVIGSVSVSSTTPLRLWLRWRICRWVHWSVVTGGYSAYWGHRKYIYYSLSSKQNTLGLKWHIINSSQWRVLSPRTLSLAVKVDVCTPGPASLTQTESCLSEQSNTERRQTTLSEPSHTESRQTTLSEQSHIERRQTTLASREGGSVSVPQESSLLLHPQLDKKPLKTCSLNLPEIIGRKEKLVWVFNGALGHSFVKH